MKKRIFFLIALIVPVFVLMIIHQMNSNDLTDARILEEITTSEGKVINILEKKVHQEKIIVFYADVPISNPKNLDRTDIGFSFFSNESSKWVKGQGGEYGSVRSYLKKNSESGFTFERFPIPDKNNSAMLFGIITDPELLQLKLESAQTGRTREVNYIPFDSYRLWYITSNKPTVNKSDFVIVQSGDAK